ncbi:MAG: AAA family ATPase [Nitrospiraceae bacterium]|nr:AAA family ATPase [Nitrospiraceae bacterium]
MAFLAAVTGKGGVGKTTFTAALVRLLIERGVRPVLAVDADPNSSLGPLLGLPPATTISDIRQELLEEKMNVTEISKERILEMKLEDCIQEADGFDLLTMGRPEGPHCYCYVNSLLRGAMAKLESNYRATVVDNEAGMEHLSRMNTSRVDCLAVVCEPTAVSARAASRIMDLAGSLPVDVGRKVLVWNKVGPKGISDTARGMLSEAAFDDVLSLPSDDAIAELSVEERSVMEITLPEPFRGLLDACMPGAPTK